ncbi:FecR family protein [Agrobacterium tumefaciens]|uniref:FecR family protein n=1 Tax=Agrobacterium tumefaciens TaxID=358 RepID=UPI00157403DF|nr:FecR domain-containing protein [Agrobacterium tumefaciens]WCK05675.1 FecR domain-containing protein [Agrobacterium tumefaciens]
MTEGFSDEDRLFDEAVDLLIRLQNDPGNPVAIEMIRRWRMRGQDHENAWVEAVEIHGMAGTVLTGQRKGQAAHSSRRTFMIGGFLVAAAAGSYAVPGLITQAKADYITTTAEIRRVPLPDGSSATLGPDSAIAVGFTSNARIILLLKGMAFFEVAEDINRPFNVEIGGVRATALGTAFDVSSDAGFITVAVTHGVVEVHLPRNIAARPEQLAAGERITFNEEDQSLDSGTREVAQIAAWRDGLVVTEKEAISAVVARIGRWHPGRVVLTNSALGKERISGVFDLRNPLLALKAVVHPYGGNVRTVTRFLTIIS